ncbi:hypothetical protein GGX14DRAFT_384361 [Mycena pura]|uniref:Uncharacterized protein n=1 Tax=Mycena pura TaxID=153505 RepID=A0AAD6YVG5_9AGAR|nr:hypothetical protein GGX14DRAFT_384361 [Mycena pura]
MDFVPSSQPLEDEYLLSTNLFAGSPSPANPPSPCPPQEDLDIIASSQPFEDGEEDLKACTPVAIDTERRREMLTKARMLCDSAAEQLPTRPSMFPLHVFQNVHAAVA